ncbi:hypothetical protein KIN20_010829 [Parelaphostrongylus tenuis]|uniref:Uncharacterized protein n=1 Tax=Parelaphostrongylus tenuis TaxID=148309 RepID=A0AAD5QKI4_PARTN|nr:hypothetical protein KIN20_010829 [Parelaphostrongylus tenuis]
MPYRPRKAVRIKCRSADTKRSLSSNSCSLCYGQMSVNWRFKVQRFVSTSTSIIPTCSKFTQYDRLSGRKIPMYIDLKEMHLPPAISRSSSTPIRISAPMPQHFVWMLKKLRLLKVGQ